MILEVLFRRKQFRRWQIRAEVVQEFGVRRQQFKVTGNSCQYRGAEEASVYDEITYLGFPFSVSETFQQRNTNSSIEQSLERVEEIQNLCIKNRKQLVVYISMGFGNPYGDCILKKLFLSG